MTIVSNAMSEGPKPETGIRLTEQQLRARRSRSIAIALALGAFVVVIFGSNVLTRPM